MHSMRTASDVLSKFVEPNTSRVVAKWSPFEDRERPDVLGFVFGLDSEEHGVVGGKSFVGHRFFDRRTYGRGSNREEGLYFAGSRLALRGRERRGPGPFWSQRVCR